MSETLAYLRVSSTDQNLARQYEALKHAGITTDREPFAEKVSGKNTDRPALQEMLGYVRKGDTVVVASLDRLARSLTDLDGIVTDLNGKGVTVRFLKEGLTFEPGEATDPFKRAMFQMLGVFAEFERNVTKIRQADGIVTAKAEGKYKGRQPSLTPQQADEIRALIAEGVNKSEIARRYGVDRSSLYRALARTDA